MGRYIFSRCDGNNNGVKSDTLIVNNLARPHKKGSW